MSDSDRLTDLEIRIAYLEDTLNALDGVVSRQTENINLLERMNQELYRRLLELEVDGKDSRPGEEPPPPHY